MEIVHVIVGPRQTRFLQPYPQAALRELLSFHPTGYEYMPSYRDGSWDGLIRFLKYDKIPSGLYRTMKDKIRDKLGVSFEETFEPSGVQFLNTLHPATADARPYQLECVTAMKASSELGGGIVLAPTGAGKTFITALFLGDLVGQACFIVDELTLLDQARAEIEDVLKEKVGYVGRSQYEVQRLTVATIQTLSRHRTDPMFVRWLKGLQIFMIDEYHVMLNRRQSDLIEQFRPPVVIGLTATLSLEKLWTRIRAYSLAGPVIFRYERATAEKEGFLTRGIAVQLALSTYARKSRDDDWTREYRKLVTRNERRNEIAGKLTQACLEAGRRVIVLVEWVEHLAAVADVMKELGLQYRIAYGARTAAQRRKAIEEFEAGKTNLILANKVFGKGINIKTLDCIIDLTAGRDANAALQRFGRGVRLSAGKKSLLYFDIADYGNRLEEFTRLRRKAFVRSRIRVLQIPYKSSLDLKALVDKTIELSEEQSNDPEDNVKKVSARKGKAGRSVQPAPTQESLDFMVQAPPDGTDLGGPGGSFSGDLY